LGYVAAPVVHHWGLISLGHAIFTRTDLNHLGYLYQNRLGHAIVSMAHYQGGSLAQMQIEFLLHNGYQ
jgi:hypothetical protein